MRYSLIFALAAGLFVLLLAALPAAADDRGSVPVYTVADTTGDWGFPSPYAHYARGPGYTRMSFLFDTLIWKDDAGYVPALAESWELVGDDTYIFSLRDGVTWHDGEPFTADDVVFTVEYIKDHPYMWVDSGIVDDAEAIDDLTVKMTLSAPFAPFLDQVAGTLPILPEHIWAGISDTVNYREQDALVGTGPYTLRVGDYDKVQGTYRYVAYEDYYLGSPRVLELRFVKTSAPNAAAELLQGRVNTAGIEPEMIGQLESSFEILSVPGHWWNYKLMINHQKEPLSDKRFRQALAYAIDRDKLVDIAARGYGLAGSPGFIPSDNEWYNPEIDGFYPHDPAKARDLLADMGYAGQRIQLLIKGGDTSAERIGELIEADLVAVGINVDLRTMDSKTVDSKVGEWDFDLAVSGHGGVIGDPNFLAGNTLDDDFNSARYHDNPELVALLEEQVTQTNEGARRDLIDRAQILYAEDVPALTLYYTESFVAHDGQVELYYTYNGMALGVPIALNKLSFVGV
ncbi:MAG: Extracellular solute-binding protein, family 5 [Methanothrix sp.]|jgi:peptide/nickel transport system substrate-binding protein|nr:MAG: Extracellular solute-binding protein, family 5 [Methanothrix sp.]